MSTQVLKGSWLTSQQLAPHISMHQSILEGPPKPLEVVHPGHVPLELRKSLKQGWHLVFRAHEKGWGQLLNVWLSQGPSPECDSVT